MKKLFLDDIRVPGDVTWIDIGPGPWSIVRSFDEAVAWVHTNGFPDVIAFDHDLGYEGYDVINGMTIVTNATEEKSGHDFAKWLIGLDLDGDVMPDKFHYVVHSMNPEGVKNIRGLLDGYIQFKKKSKI
jgi:hypothetical protein